MIYFYFNSAQNIISPNELLILTDIMREGKLALYSNEFGMWEVKNYLNSQSHFFAAGLLRDFCMLVFTENFQKGNKCVVINRKYDHATSFTQLLHRVVRSIDKEYQKHWESTHKEYQMQTQGKSVFAKIQGQSTEVISLKKKKFQFELRARKVPNEDFIHSTRKHLLNVFYVQIMTIKARTFTKNCKQVIPGNT